MLFTDMKNKWFLTKSNDIVKMIYTTYTANEPQICGVSMKYKFDLFEKPFKSSSLIIYKITLITYIGFIFRKLNDK